MQVNRPATLPIDLACLPNFNPASPALEHWVPSAKWGRVTGSHQPLGLSIWEAQLALEPW